MATRLIAKDTSAFTVDVGTDVLALLTTWEITGTRPEIDVSPIADDFDTKRQGSYSWKVSLTKLTETAAVLGTKFTAGGSVAFSCKEAATGKTYSGSAVVTDWRLSGGSRNGRQEESCTLSGNGALSIT